MSQTYDQTLLELALEAPEYRLVDGRVLKSDPKPGRWRSMSTFLAKVCSDDSSCIIWQPRVKPKSCMNSMKEYVPRMEPLEMLADFDLESVNGTWQGTH